MNLLICLNWERMKKYTLNAHDIVALPFPPWSQQCVPMQIHSSLKTHIFPGNIPSKGGPQGFRPLLQPTASDPCIPHTPWYSRPVCLQCCSINLGGPGLPFLIRLTLFILYTQVTFHPLHVELVAPLCAFCHLVHSLFYEVSPKSYVKMIYVLVGKGPCLIHLWVPSP